MEKNQISIIVPVYNNAKDIQETIDSILSQTYQNWEAIFVDDGSQDNTLDIIKRNASQENRIRFTQRHRNPKGGSTCRNIGASMSNGEFLIFLDGDDLLAPTCLEKRWNNIKDTEFDFIVYPMSMFSTSLSETKRLTKWKIRDFDYYYITGAPAWQVTSPIYRRSFFEKLNGFDEKFTRSQDIELGLRSVILSNNNFMTVENIESDCFYRVPAVENDVPSYKFIKQLESYEFMLRLIYKLKLENAFKNSYKFSLGVLATYCHMLQLMYILKGRNEKVESFSTYNKVDLRSYMKCYHRVLLSIFQAIILPYSCKRKLALKINQYCRWHFMF